MARVYDKSSLNPADTEEDASRCIKEVYGWREGHSHQCYGKRGHGPDGLYCKQHAKIVEGNRES